MSVVATSNLNLANFSKAPIKAQEPATTLGTNHDQSRAPKNQRRRVAIE
jgi:hypothetical protein